VNALGILLLVAITLLIGFCSMSGSSAAGASATGYTPQQEEVIKGLEIGYKLGQMYALAQQGYNVSGFNAEVDKYNVWVQQNFGNDPNLVMSKMSTIQESGNVMPRYFPVPRINSVKPIHAIDASFNQTTPLFPPGAVQNGQIFDMPAGAWWTTYGPYLPDYYGGSYYGRNYHGRNFYRDYYGALPG
jgi:hypothetical protein